MHLLPLGTPPALAKCLETRAAALRGHSMSDKGFATQAPEAFVANPQTLRGPGGQAAVSGVAAAGKGWLLRDMVVDVVSLPLWPVGWVPPSLPTNHAGDLGNLGCGLGLRKAELGVFWRQENGLAFCT